LGKDDDFYCSRSLLFAKNKKADRTPKKTSIALNSPLPSSLFLLPSSFFPLPSSSFFLLPSSEAILEKTLAQALSWHLQTIETRRIHL
jgi:hypothetical protein